ncbi:MAG: ATP-binding protein [PVC group bacterium]
MNIMTSGTFDEYRDDVGVYLRFFLINMIAILSGTFLLGYGIFDIFQGQALLGLTTVGAGILLLINFVFLRATRKYLLAGWVAALLIAGFFAFLLSTGGSENSGPLWIYTLPGVAFILLGAKAGTFLMLAFYAFSALVLLVPESPLLFTWYSPAFVRRFFSSLLTVQILAYLFVHMRVLSQKMTVQKNRELEAAIADARRVEKALRESEKRFRDISFSMADWIWEINREGVYTYASKSVKGILGFEPDELMGKTPFDLMDRKESKRVGKMCLKTMAEGRPIVDLENWNLAKSGQKVCLLTNGVPILDQNGEIIGYRGVDKDITDRKLMEAEFLKTQKLESVGILAGGIAHDFNNILTAILGNISLVKMGVKHDKELIRSLSESEHACQQAKNLTQQLLTFSRGGLPVKKTIVIANLIREAATLALRGSSSRCEFAIADDLKPVDVDPGQMNQVINNIVLNAGQAMPDGGVVRVRAENFPVGRGVEPAPGEGEYVRIEIQDTGTGISPEIVHKVFDPYFSTKKAGSGLGLAVAYSIVKNHQGVITVDSEKDSGTTFTIYLPVSSEPGEMEREKGGELIFGRGRVLLMDDEEAVRNVTEKIIRYLGYEIDYADDGRVAVEMYRKAREEGSPYDLVILDLTVPGGMGGKETAEKILEIDRGARLVIASGYSSDTAGFSRPAGGYYRAFLTKPYRIKEISEVLDRVVKSE